MCVRVGVCVYVARTCTLMRYIIFCSTCCLQKLQDRRSVFKKRTGYSEKNIEKWNKVFVCDLMSSEESGEDEMIIVRPLPWRNPRVDELFVSLDDQLRKEQSAQAKRQMKKRTIGLMSSRSKPVAGSVPSWALKWSSYIHTTCMYTQVLDYWQF